MLEKANCTRQADLFRRANLAKNFTLLPILLENYSNTFYIAFQQNKYKLVILVS